MASRIKFEKIDLNIELRSAILTKALNLEKSITSLVILYLNISQSEKDFKLFGSKSSSMSFRGKLDLLFDLGVLDNPEITMLNEFMEIRNKLMHVYECNSFIEVVNQLGNKNKLLKNYNSTEIHGTNEEANIAEAVKNLYLQCVKIIVEKIEAKTEILKKKQLIVEALVNNFKMQVNTQVNITATILDILKEYAENGMDSEKIIERLQKPFVTDSLLNNEEYVHNNNILVEHEDLNIVKFLIL